VRAPAPTPAPNAYTPKHLADKILTSRAALEGERKQVAVLFADLANFTQVSERLAPEELHELMDLVFEMMLTEVHRYEGTVNQFTGDGSMALFGAPVALQDHALRAVEAALAVQRAMALGQALLEFEPASRAAGPVEEQEVGARARAEHLHGRSADVQVLSRRLSRQ
jgi:class 3 adenylate cyclase